MRKIDKRYVKITTFIDITNQGIKKQFTEFNIFHLMVRFQLTRAKKLKELSVVYNQVITCSHYCSISIAQWLAILSANEQAGQKTRN